MSYVKCLDCRLTADQLDLEAAVKHLFQHRLWRLRGIPVKCAFTLFDAECVRLVLEALEKRCAVP